MFLYRISQALFVIFFLLCISQCANAAPYYWNYGNNPATNSSTPAQTCQLIATSRALTWGSGATFYSGKLDQLFTPTQGRCNLYTTAAAAAAGGDSYQQNIFRYGDSCPTSGQVQNATTGACECPSGTVPTSGDLFQRLNGGSTSACRTPAQECSNRAGASRESTWPQTSIEGCIVTCAANTGANKAVYPYRCTYSGQLVGGADNNALSSGTSSPISADPVAPEIPPGCTTPATSACASGTSYGFVNGAAVCAGTSSSCAPGGSGGTSGTPIVNGAPAGTTIETSTSATTTNANGTTTTTTVHSTIGGTGTGGTGNGSGTGTGDGEEGEGSGECDPTAKDYLQCLAGDPSDYADFGDGEATRDSVSGDFYSGLQQTGIGQLAGSISGGLPSGSCPIVQFEMFNRSYVMDFWCTVYEENSSVLSTVARAGWVLMGIVIILGA